MKLIIGLGNPGAQYSQTRHNIGFIVVDQFVRDLKTDWKLWGPGKNSDLAQSQIGSEKIIILKPLTYMNLSGQSASAVASFFKIPPDEICVLHDDLDIPFGEVRLKVGGGDGGHNGLKSLTQQLGTPKYSRIRLGIGRPPHPQMDTADFVLSPFSNSDWSTVDSMVDKSLQAVRAFTESNQAFMKAMNTFNKKQ
jgi:PTH1 family peptidyl-tRNA hydrolase